MAMPDAAALAGPLRHAALMQLASGTLPIGGFSYSQGLEAAINEGWVRDEAALLRWVQFALTELLPQADAAVWRLLYRAAQGRGAAPQPDPGALAHWDAWLRCSRESAELRQESRQMGWSLVQWALALPWPQTDARAAPLLAWLRTRAGEPGGCSYVAAHAVVAVLSGLSEDEGLSALLYAGLEGQVMAGVKAIPLGQQAGQRVLRAAHTALAQGHVRSRALADADPPALNTWAPQWAMLSSRHETQFSRLFRS
ncbi:urease accessory protein UreF [Amphibiibacter pelophylacis]|uniref:Urease accessory UreF family protein n=1 Tax=Amphibiibacter pelophylacis TaxID=1799477 RepID=A0ACC6P1H6_9BURK